MGTVFYDNRTGNLAHGKVWQLLTADAFEYLVGDLGWDKSVDIKDCSLDKRHVTGYDYEICVDLFSGDEGDLGDFVPLLYGLHWEFLIVSERFARRLKTSPLTGYQLRPVRISDNQSSIRNPKLFWLVATGRGGVSHRLKVQGAPNLCPFCGKEPLICPACGILNGECLSCGQQAIVGPREPLTPNDRRLRSMADPPDEWVVEAKDWDGSDCFEVKQAGGFFLSNRAKEWLEATHTYPIDIKPALLNAM